MSERRILSLWFPRLGAERLVRRNPALAGLPLAVIEQYGSAQTISAQSVEAQAAGVYVGQPVRDAHAVCPDLHTYTRDPLAEAGFLAVLQRWAGKFSPWAAPEGTDGLVVDLTGCAHLFGGEAALLEVVRDDCADLGLSVSMGLADTRGAAWALARFAGAVGGSDRSGDAIDQEARATRSRAGKRRHWTKGGAAPARSAPSVRSPIVIAPPGQSYGALAPLPIAALRLEPDLVAALNRLGLRQIADLLGQPRASLARRFGRGLVLRMDQAMGSAPEPVSPARPPDHFAVRMTLPDPIGLAEDVMAAIDRLLPRLCASLRDKGRGMRRVRVQAFRTDHAVEAIDIGLARATHDPDRVRPLIALKIDALDAGFGIDMLRLEALQTEVLHARSTAGHAVATAQARQRAAGQSDLEDLMGRLGARIGLEQLTRLYPASSHIPEKTHKILAAAWAEPYSEQWPAAAYERPILLWQPEPVTAPDHPTVPTEFRWRGQTHTANQVTGPERVAPEWWLEDPNWRSGVRDYWVVDTGAGQRLWLFYGHGGAMSSGWFCQGQFA